MGNSPVDKNFARKAFLGHMENNREGARTLGFQVAVDFQGGTRLENDLYAGAYVQRCPMGHGHLASNQVRTAALGPIGISQQDGGGSGSRRRKRKTSQKKNGDKVKLSFHKRPSDLNVDDFNRMLNPQRGIPLPETRGKKPIKRRYYNIKRYDETTKTWLEPLVF